MSDPNTTPDPTIDPSRLGQPADSGMAAAGPQGAPSTPPFGTPPSGTPPYGTPPEGMPLNSEVTQTFTTFQASTPPPYQPQAGFGPVDPGTPPTGQAPAVGIAAGRPRGPAGSGGSGPGRTPAALMVASVIGLAVLVAVGAWFLLLRPGESGTAAGSPSPSATVLLSPTPEATETAEPSPIPSPTPRATPAPTPFKAPKFTGLTLDDAQALADQRHVKLEVEYRETNDAEADTILEQAPPPGSAVLPDDTVFLVVARPAPTVEVPDLRGMPEDDAFNALLEADLLPGQRSEVTDPDIEAGSVIRTDPRAGIEVARQTTVNYIVSTGPEPTAEPTPSPSPSPSPTPEPTPFAAPALVGMTQAEAQAAADALALELDVSTQATDTADPGVVLAQDPQAGAPVFEGDHIAVVVAIQTPTVEVPDLRGVPVDDAVNLLLEADLQPGARSEAHHPDIEAGSVIRTDPRAGIQVARGTLVDYLVSSGPEPTPSPSPSPSPTPAPTPIAAPALVGMTQAQAQSTTEALELVLDVSTQATDTVDPGTVISQDPEAGADLFSGDHIAVVVAILPPTVLVPDVSGQTEDDAVNILLAADLQPGGQSGRFDDGVEAGRVIGTDPAANTEVDRGSSVDYVLSKGPRPTPSPTPSPSPTPEPTPFAAPALVGMTQAEAQAAADSLALELDVSTQATDTADPGVVLAQDPQAGAPVFEGDHIAVVVAIQTPTVEVPDLRGVPVDDAVNLLLEADLQPGARSEAHHPDIEAGSVIRTDPRAGIQVARGTLVDYLVSSGPEPTPSPSPSPSPTPAPTPIAAPALVGMTQAQAQSTTEALELVLDVSTQATDTVDPGTVISQDPEAGADLFSGDHIAVVVAILPPTVLVPDVSGQTEDDAVNILLAADLQPGGQSGRFDDGVEAGRVIGTDPAANTEVDRGSSVDYVLSKGPRPTPSPSPSPSPTPEPTPFAAPALVGRDIADARDIAARAGLILDVSRQATAEALPGTVLSQDPQADTDVFEGDHVSVVVASKPPTVTVPDLRGVPVADAVNLLLEADLQPGQRDDRFNDQVEAGRVFRTVPRAGAEVDHQSVVDYFVSKGPEPTATPSPTPEPTSSTVLVPEVRGDTPDDAVNSLLEAGLQPGTPTEHTNAQVPEGRVIKTIPKAGTEVERGSSVDYVVSLGPPTSEATPEPTPEPAPTGEPTASGAPGIKAAIDEVMSQVPPIRGLDPTQPVPYREITPKQLRKELQRQFDQDNPPDQVAAEEAFLKRMGLLPADADLRALMLKLYQSQVAAFYDPETQTMTIIDRDGEFGPADRVVVAHEYDHALQDQHWDLQKLRVKDVTQGDRASARLGLIEGDATALMAQWALANLGPDVLSQLGDSLSPTDLALLGDMPPLLRRQLSFPYFDGYLFVGSLLGQGGWDAVNAAWDKLPGSTEQIMHPEKYPSDKPVKIGLPDVAGRLGRGWSTPYEQTLGEMEMGVFLADGQAGDAPIPGLAVQLPNAEAAAGWGGDRLVSLDGPDGTWAVVWQTDWDGPTDADEFSAAADAAMSDLAGSHAVLPATDVTGSGLAAPVLVVAASDEATLQAVETALGVGG